MSFPVIEIKQQLSFFDSNRVRTYVKLVICTLTKRNGRKNKNE